MYLDSTTEYGWYCRAESSSSVTRFDGALDAMWMEQILSASRLATHDQTSAYHEGTHRSNDSRGMLNVLDPRRRAMCWALGSACKTKLAYLHSLVHQSCLVNLHVMPCCGGRKRAAAEVENCPLRQNSTRRQIRYCPVQNLGSCAPACQPLGK